MTAFAWVAVLAYAAIAAGLGHLALRVFRIADRPFLDTSAASYLCGQLVIHALTVATAFLPIGLTTLIHIASAAGLVGALLLAGQRARCMRDQPREFATHALALVCFLAAFPAVVVLAHATGTVEWDARMIWMFHGKALFVEDGVRSQFFGSPALWWSNLDYPLLLPSQAAWSAHLAGAWSGIVCKAHLLVTLLAWFTLLSKTIARLVGNAPISYLAAAGLMMLGHAHPAPYDYMSGMADRHYATPLLIGALAVHPRGWNRTVPFFSLMLAYAANVKNEASVYVAGLLLATAIILAIRRRAEWRTILHERGALMLAGALGIAPLLMWKLYARSQAIPGGLGLWQQITNLPSRLTERLGTVLEHVALGLHASGATWAAGAIVLLGSLGIARHRRLGFTGHEAALFAATFSILAMVVGVFVLTPHDYVLHMNMAMSRLTVLPTCVLGALAVGRLSYWFHGAGDSRSS